MANLMAPPGHIFLNNNGTALSLGKIYTYEAGTSTPKATYEDSAETTPHDNPVILDQYGMKDIYLLTDGLYKIVIKDSNDATIKTVDNVAAPGGSITTGITAAGNLDMNGYAIVSNSNGDIDIQPNGTGKTNIDDPVMKNNLDLDGNNVILTDGKGFIEPSTGNQILLFNIPANAVNNFQVDSAATGSGPILSSIGDDTNVELNFQAKGTGPYNFKATSTSSSEIRLFEDTDNGSNYIGLKSPNSVASSISFVLPSTDGTANQMLVTDGALNLSFIDAPDIAQLTSGSISAQASLDLTSIISSTYQIYDIYLIGAIPATDNVVLNAKVSTNNGSTWEAGSSYNNSYTALYNNTASTGNVNGGAAFQLHADNITNTLPGVYKITLAHPATSGKKTYFTCEGYNTDQATTYQRVISSAGYWDSTTAVNAFQIYASSGNITTDYIVYGRK